MVKFVQIFETLLKIAMAIVTGSDCPGAFQPLNLTNISSSVIYVINFLNSIKTVFFFMTTS